MITRAQVVCLVLQKVPSFQKPYDNWFTDEGAALIEGKSEEEKADFLARVQLGDSTGVPIYLMPLPTHLKALHEQGNLQELMAALDFIEHCLVEGDEYISNWAVIGVLEGINGNDKFIPFLGPESMKAWNELNDFWTQQGKWKSKWIQKAEILSLLTRSVPSFARPFHEWVDRSEILIHKSDVKDHADLQLSGPSFEIDYYQLPVASILLRIHNAGRFEEVQRAADLIERFITKGDAYVSKWAVQSVLAGVKTEWKSYGIEKIVPFLGSKSLHYWKML